MYAPAEGSNGIASAFQKAGILVHRKKHEMGLSQSLFHAFFYKNYHFVDYNRSIPKCLLSGTPMQSRWTLRQVRTYSFMIGSYIA